MVERRLGGDLLAEEHSPLESGAFVKPPTDKILILFVAAKIKEILFRGKDYPWPRPDLCPRCQVSGVWGHGFVLACFDGLSEGLWLRR